MEKLKPHCSLARIHSLINSDRVQATTTAFIGARTLGIRDLEEICAVVLQLTQANFYKSMTTYADHKIWQDVYRTRLGTGASVYIKLMVVDDVLIVSFKELGS